MDVCRYGAVDENDRWHMEGYVKAKSNVSSASTFYMVLSDSRNLAP